MKIIIFLLCLHFFSNKIVAQIIPVQVFLDAGTVYGIKASGLEITNFDLKHLPSFQASVGVRLSNYKQKHFFQIQGGYTSANYSISKDGKNIPLISNHTSANNNGPLNSTTHMVAAKAAYLYQVKQFVFNKRTLMFFIGAGASYVFDFDGKEYYFENRSFSIDEYGLSISIDQKFENSNGNTQKVEIIRKPNIQALIGMQYNTVNKPLAFEMYWNPAITPAIQSTYLLTRNFVKVSDGRTQHMQNTIGVKMLYQFKIKQHRLN